jgi:hydrogenase nickel incorporation protein HypB
LLSRTAMADRTAANNRQHFAAAGVLAVNLMGSAGSGKTAVLEASAWHAAAHGECLRMGTLSGDLVTDRDARRLRAAGIPSRAITTGSACHVDAEMVRQAMQHVAWRGLDAFVIENVGNLVCPAVYDLGQSVNVVALSVTEGEDKPMKYPVMFHKADLVLLTKVDLLSVLDVDLAAIEDALAHVMRVPRMILMSAKTGQGVGEWLTWLRTERMKLVLAQTSYWPTARAVLHGNREELA